MEREVELQRMKQVHVGTNGDRAGNRGDEVEMKRKIETTKARYNENEMGQSD